MEMRRCTGSRDFACCVRFASNIFRRAGREVSAIQSLKMIEYLKRLASAVQLAGRPRFAGDGVWGREQRNVGFGP
jgi:hypothetical protein